MEAAYWFARYQVSFGPWQNVQEYLEIPGGESLQEVQTRRAIHTLRRVSKLYPPGSTLLLCSHHFPHLCPVMPSIGVFPLDPSSGHACGDSDAQYSLYARGSGYGQNW